MGRLGLVISLLLGILTASERLSAQPNQATPSKPFLREIRTDKLSRYILAFDIANGSDLAAAALGDLTVRIWKLNSGDIVHELSFSEPETDQRQKLEREIEPISVRFAPDGKSLAVSFLSAIHIYDVGTWQERSNLSVAGENNVRPGLRITPATPELKKRSRDQADADRSKPEGNLNQKAREWAVLKERGDGRTRVTDFMFTQDGSFALVAYCRGGCYASLGRRWLAFPSGGDPVRLWDVRNSRIVWEREYDPRGVIERLVPSPDGKRFVAVNAQLGKCAVGVYELGNGSQLISFPFTRSCDPPPSVLFSKEGKYLITRHAGADAPKDKSWRRLATYETNSGKLVADFSFEDIRDADISPDGLWLASTSWWEKRFQLWDVTTKLPVTTVVPREFKRRHPLIDRLRFSPDGRWLVVGSNETGDLAVYEFGLSRSGR